MRPARLSAPTVDSRRHPPRWYFDLTAWVAALSVSGYPLAGMLSTYWEINDDRLTVPFRVLVVILAACALLQARARSRFSALSGLLVAFWALYLIRLLWDAYIADVPSADTALLAFVVAVLIPVVAVSISARVWDDRNAAYCFMTTGALVCAAGLFFWLSGVLDLAYYEETGRLGFEKVNPISMGHVGCTTALVATVHYFYVPGGLRHRIIALVCAALGLALLVLGASRGPILAFVAALASYVVLSGTWRNAWVLFGTLYAAMTILAFADIDSLLRQLRFATELDELDLSSLERLSHFREAFEAFEQSPILGHSALLPISGGWVHNIFLESLMALGVCGLLLLVALCIRSFLASAAAIRTSQIVVPMLFLQFLVAAQFSGALWGWPGLWMGVALVNAGRMKRASNRLARKPIYQGPPRTRGSPVGHIQRTHGTVGTVGSAQQYRTVE